jgi:RNA polymerase sigma-70 factor, ECF subfamily
MDDERREEPLLAAVTSLPTAAPPPVAASIATGETLSALFTQHHERVFRAAYRITGNATDAEDVLQTVFMRLLRREEEIDLDTGAASYLHRAAVNAALDLLRSRKRSRLIDLAEVGEALTESPEAGPERLQHSRETAQLLRRALTKVSARASEIFSLRYFEGLDNREIAEQLGTSQTAIAVILHRTRHRLGKELAPLLGGIQS